MLFLVFRWDNGDDIRITRVDDGETRDLEVFTAGSSQVEVVSGVVMDSGVGQQSVVFNLGSSEGRGVVRDDNKLGTSVSDSLEGGLVSKGELSGFDHKGQSGVDGFRGFLGFFGWHFFSDFLFWYKGLFDF